MGTVFTGVDYWFRKHKWFRKHTFTQNLGPRLIYVTDKAKII